MTRTFSVITALFIIMVSACTEEKTVEPDPVEHTRDHSCAVCGMIIVDFPGAKAQVHYKNGAVDHFCSTLDMFMFHNQPDKPPHITRIFVNDMGRTDWDHPHDHWIDAEKAFYVYGGDIMGPMGEALVPFSRERDAEKYVSEHGGRIVMFEEVTMEMLRPDVHD